MSSIERLGVTGIRSFDPELGSVLIFYSPLTLIVGANGCGKTTLIECLKYAVTGQVPPNTGKGASFVHDPHLAGMTSVKGQVRLRFKNTSGETLVATRIMSLTMKKTKLEFKTLDGSLLLKNKDNTKQSLSSRVSDLDAEIPQQLGVSKAVLENVIFCHQEEANWPLSDPATLKAKFDDIFASTRYTKAHEDIKKLARDERANLKFLESECAQLGVEKERAERLSVRIEASKKEAEQLESKRARISDQIAEVLAKHAELNGLYTKWEAFEREISRLNAQKSLLERNVQDLKGKMDLFTGSDEELTRLSAAGTTDTTAAQQRLEAVKTERDHLNDQLAGWQVEASALSQQVGQYRSAQEAYRRNVEKRDETILQLAAKHNLHDFAIPPIDQEMADAFVSVLGSEVNKQQKLLDAMKTDFRQVEATLQKELQDLTKQRDMAEDMRAMRKKAITDGKAREASLKSTLDALGGEGQALPALQAARDESEAALQGLKATLTQLESSRQIEGFVEAAHTLNDKMSRLRDELRHLHSLGDIRARLDIKEDEKKRHEENIERLQRAIGPDVERLLQRPSTPDQWDLSLADAKSTKESELELAQRALQAATNDVTRKQTIWQGHTESMDAKTKEAAALREQFESVYTGVDIENDIAKAENELRINDAETARAAVQLYQQILEESQRRQCCDTCNRKFNSASQFDGFLASLKQKIEVDLPQRLDRFKPTQAKLEKWRALLPDYRILSHLENEVLPQLQDHVATSQTAYAKAKETANYKRDAAQRLQEEVNFIAEIRSRVDDIGTQRRGLQNVINEMSQMQMDVESVAGTPRSTSDVQTDLDTAQEEANSVQRRLETLRAERSDLEKRVLQAEAQFGQHRDALRDAQARSAEKERMTAELAALRQTMEEAEHDLRSQTSGAQHVIPRISEIEFQLSKRQQQYYEDENRVGADVRKVERSQMMLESILQDMNQYLKSDNERLLSQATRQSTQLEQTMRKARSQLAEHNESITELDRHLNDVKGRERMLADNIRYRQWCYELKELDERIVAQRSESDGRDATEWLAEAKSYDRKHADLSAERGGLIGELKQVQERIKEDEKSMRSDFKNIRARHHEKLIQARTAQMALTDLDRYAKALDSAIMEFHSLRMQEINQIIRELWTNTYKGNDIDTIEIKSESETLQKNRRYNYRIVMVKNGKEIDMRGRCSAGQKVLASIIVRLALAETFCIHCGIFALDEPTTNLDQENIQSLARSLSQIIASRQAQRNFQLIVITHDEQFLQMLGQSQYADYYWRVLKNEKGHSCIEQYAIAE